MENSYQRPVDNEVLWSCKVQQYWMGFGCSCSDVVLSRLIPGLIGRVRVFERPFKRNEEHLISRGRADQRKKLASLVSTVGFLEQRLFFFLWGSENYYRYYAAGELKLI